MLRYLFVAILALAVFLSCPTTPTTVADRDEQPPQQPTGVQQQTATLRAGKLIVELRDNSTSPATLSGLQSLFHASAPSFDAFDPDTPGASAGLNFEHIISGHRNDRNKFTPRYGKYSLYVENDRAAATLVRERSDGPWDVSSTLQYSLAPPHAVDFEFRCQLHSPERFGKRGYGVFFFANYMNDTEGAPIHFRGVAAKDEEEKWVRADTPNTYPDWNTGGTFGHLEAKPLQYDDDVEFRLNTWSYDWPRYTEPFYYGRAAKGMVFILCFDRAMTERDEIRFSLFKFKLGKWPRPAWDFQYVIREIDAESTYGFCGRLIWKPWVSAEDCYAEYRKWRRSIETKKE